MGRCTHAESLKRHLADLFVSSAIPTWTNSNIQAGSDTTSIMMMAVFYYCLKNPSTMTRLCKEIDEAVRDGRLSVWATWKESQQLPYLDACIKEASRIHPPIGFPLERIVPSPGIKVDGIFIPSDTRVSMNPYSVHRSKEMFGEDADCWRPERWLCDDKMRKAMYNSLLTVKIIAHSVSDFSSLTIFYQFGAGHRTCLGKNISYLETYILIPSFLQRYNVSGSTLGYQ
jgi:cytochrome P450